MSPTVAAVGASAVSTVRPYVVASEEAKALPGAGPLTSLLLDPEVTDVLVNGGEVWVDRGAGLQRAALRAGSALDVRRLAQRLAAACGRRLDEACPFVDARLPDGTRLHAVLPPIATSGPYLSLRTFRHRALSLTELVESGTVTAGGAELLAAIVTSRLSFLVSGGTGTGKTTMLASLLSLVAADERIVIVEDSAELRPHHPHAVSLQGRTANVEGAGEVTLRDLVRQALRMRPDRLVVGECRGAEVVDLLGALNTGHDGGSGTVHANAASDVPARLAALGLLSGIPGAAVHAQVAAGLRLVVHMSRGEAGRRVDEIALLRPARTGVVTVPAWRWQGGVKPGSVALADLLMARGVRPPASLVAGS